VQEKRKMKRNDERKDNRQFLIIDEFEGRNR
jgi:hypothetical protein